VGGQITLPIAGFLSVFSRLSHGICCALEPFSGFDKVKVFPLYAVSEFAREREKVT